MVIDLVSCSGCMACKNICPTDAISTIESKDGFILPHIDENKCVQCGLCEAVCDFKRSNHIGDNILNVYSLAHCDKSVIKHSSSGGAFTAFSDKVFEKGGVVYGVTYDEDFNIVYSAANTIEERNRMRGSKYVQSDPKLVYRQIKKDLEERLVLFVGTPCQCAGLRSYLKKGYNNLIIVDFLCHGVPNNRMFKEHISLISRRHKGNLVDYSFRAKQYGWNSYANVATFAELFQNHNSYAKKRQTKEDASWSNQAFLFFFSDNLSLRPSCFNCPYRVVCFH